MMMRRVWSLVLMFAGVALLRPAHVLGQGEMFELGNQLYQEDDFAGAIEAYEAVLEAGWESPDLYYNLGNSYFKLGELGRSILQWERALAGSPGDPDVLSNLELARSITADAVESLPRFWLFSAVRWWVDLIPRGLLIVIVGSVWLVTAVGCILKISSRSIDARRLGSWLTLTGVTVVLVLGTNLAVRELGIGRAELGVILAEIVSVQAAPSDEDDITLFEIHEGTRVRIDQRAGDWAEIVLEDGKVGWVPAEVMEVI
jgi:tetratricopeptide (TPR) repeat protein